MLVTRASMGGHVETALFLMQPTDAGRNGTGLRSKHDPPAPGVARALRLAFFDSGFRVRQA
jgi:hypothetical protein